VIGGEELQELYLSLKDFLPHSHPYQYSEAESSYFEEKISDIFD
jgi:hypothetical protein